MSSTEKVQRTKTGRVTSNKADKTVTVLLERQVQHPLYGKYMKRSTKVHAHDEDNSCGEGDLVRGRDLTFSASATTQLVLVHLAQPTGTVTGSRGINVGA